MVDERVMLLPTESEFKGFLDSLVGLGLEGLRGYKEDYKVRSSTAIRFYKGVETVEGKLVMLSEVIDVIEEGVREVELLDGASFIISELYGDSVEGKLVYVASPLKPYEGSTFENNLEFAKELSRRVTFSGGIPMTPHLYFSQFLDDFVEAERNIGIEMGLAIMDRCDTVLFSGHMSNGMRSELDLAVSLGKDILIIDECPLSNK